MESIARMRGEMNDGVHASDRLVDRTGIAHIAFDDPVRDGEIAARIRHVVEDADLGAELPLQLRRLSSFR